MTTGPAPPLRAFLSHEGEQFTAQPEDGNFDPGSATYTVPADGSYSVTFNSYTEANLVSIRANGANGQLLVRAEPPTATKTVQLTANDTVAAYVDGDGTVYGGAAETYLTIDKVG